MQRSDGAVENGSRSADGGEQRRLPFDLYPWLLAGGVLLSRILTAGPVYFADGPGHVEAVQTRAYVIQPPGYWLFHRVVALFP